MDPQGLENALGSPLRLRLTAELVASGELPLDELVRRTGRHVHDVRACLTPMVRWGVLAVDGAGARYRLADDLDPTLRATLDGVLERRSDWIARERRVRVQVLGGLIGVDPKMAMIFEGIQQVARIGVPVLILGETGTGKELVARAIHELSPRGERAFGAVNCATLTTELFASEMFGHVKGAFTGAVADHVGLFARCDGGTVFLDEVGELTPLNQGKLLRVLQEGTFTPVGGAVDRSSDFRLICATNRDLAQMVRGGTFREDLYYRLNVYEMRLPSLRERPDDLPLLVDELLGAKLAHLHEGDAPPAITAAALARLRGYGWPGNVRELENVLARALVSSRGRTIDEGHLPVLASRVAGADRSRPRVIGAMTGEAIPAVDDDLRSLADVEREHITKVIAAVDGNLSTAAAVLQISRTTLYSKLRRYGIGKWG